MEQEVVGAKAVGVVRGVHGVSDVVADAHRPIEVLVPEGRVGGSDITDGTAVIALAQQRFAKAGAFVELVAEAAVANHERRLAIVGHLCHVAGVEFG